MKILLALLLSVLSTPAFAAQDCVPKEEMQVIARHFTQFAPLAQKEYCYDNTPTAHLIAGLMFMRQTRFDGNMGRSQDDLFSGRFASSWYDYLIGRIDQFVIDEGCPKGVAAYVYAFGGKTMYACTMLLSENFTALDRASVFMHEARHIDGYPHVTCSSGPRRGLQGACDTRIADGGSYAVTVETYAQLSRYALDIHPALKAYARSAAVVYADETFQNPARVERNEQFMVMDNARRFHIVKPDGSTVSLGSSPALGKIVMRGQHMILFPDDLNLTARYVFARDEGELAQQAGDLAVEYNKQTPAERGNLVDIHIAAQWSAQVFKDKVRMTCDPRSTRTEDLALGETAVGLAYPNGYDRASPTIQLMTEAGLYDLGCERGQAKLQRLGWNFDQKYVSVYKVGGLTLGLTKEGSLREIQGQSSRPFSLGKLDGSLRELAPNQSIGFFEGR